MNIFSTLPVGDTATWDDDPVLLVSPDNETADSSGWTLAYFLRGPTSLNLAATVNDDGWTTTLTIAQSSSLEAGTYAWAAVITSLDATQRITVGTGQLTITASIQQQDDPFDPRSQAQIALADCETAMATFNSTGGKVKRYEIAGRTMEFQTIADLLTLHAFWKSKVTSELATSSIANKPYGNPRNLYVRFSRP